MCCTSKLPIQKYSGVVKFHKCTVDPTSIIAANLTMRSAPLLLIALAALNGSTFRPALATPHHHACSCDALLHLFAGHHACSCDALLHLLAGHRQRLKWHAPAGPARRAPTARVLPSQTPGKHAATSRRWAATARGATTVPGAGGSWARVISAPAAHARPAAQAQIPSGRLAAFLPRQQAPSPRQRVRGLRTMPTLRACGAHLDNLCHTR